MAISSASNTPSAADENRIWDSVFHHCLSGATGTLFISCDNKAGQIVIHKGRLIALSYGGNFSQEAAQLLSALDNPRYAFTADLIFPVGETLLPEDASALLTQLGFDAFRTRTPPQEETTATSDKHTANTDTEYDTPTAEPPEQARVKAPETPKRFYRGQPVANAPVPERDASTAGKRQVRMYRGQPVL